MDTEKILKLLKGQIVKGITNDIIKMKRAVRRQKDLEDLKYLVRLKRKMKKGEGG